MHVFVAVNWKSILSCENEQLAVVVSAHGRCCVSLCWGQCLWVHVDTRVSFICFKPKMLLLSNFVCLIFKKILHFIVLLQVGRWSLCSSTWCRRFDQSTKEISRFRSLAIPSLNFYFKRDIEFFELILPSFEF